MTSGVRKAERFPVSAKRKPGQPAHRPVRDNRLTANERDYYDACLRVWDALSIDTIELQYLRPDDKQVFPRITSDMETAQGFLGEVTAYQFNESGARVFNEFRDIVSADWAKLEKAEQTPSQIAANLRFDYGSPAAAQYASLSAANMVTDMVDSQITSVRALVGQAFSDGLTQQQTSRNLFSLLQDIPSPQGVPAGVTGLTVMFGDSTKGLTKRYALAVYHKAERIVRDSPNISAAALQKRVNHYGARLRRSRARTIARTEMMRASNQGRLAGMIQAADRGLVNPTLARKQWVTSSFDVCPICVPLNGVTVSLRQSFGSMGQAPPAHPNCRCTIRMLPDPTTFGTPMSVGTGTDLDPLRYVRPQRPGLRLQDLSSMPGAVAQPAALVGQPGARGALIGDDIDLPQPAPALPVSLLDDRMVTQRSRKLRETFDEYGGRDPEAATAAMIRDVGYDAKPRVVDFDELGKLADESPTGEMRRQVGTGRQRNPATDRLEEVAPDEIAETFRQGEYFVGEGMHGRGTYVIEGSADDAAEYLAGRQATRGPHEIIEMTMESDARVYDMPSEFRHKNRPFGDEYHDLIGSDDAHDVLVALGYDAVRYPNNITVILNRGKVIVARSRNAVVDDIVSFPRPAGAVPVQPASVADGVEEIIDEATYVWNAAGETWDQLDDETRDFLVDTYIDTRVRQDIAAIQSQVVATSRFNSQGYNRMPGARGDAIAEAQERAAQKLAELDAANRARSLTYVAEAGQAEPIMLPFKRLHTKADRGIELGKADSIVDRANNRFKSGIEYDITEAQLEGTIKEQQFTDLMVALRNDVNRLADEANDAIEEVGRLVNLEVEERVAKRRLDLGVDSKIEAAANKLDDAMGRVMFDAADENGVLFNVQPSQRSWAKLVGDSDEITRYNMDADDFRLEDSSDLRDLWRYAFGKSMPKDDVSFDIFPKLMRQVSEQAQSGTLNHRNVEAMLDILSPDRPPQKAWAGGDELFPVAERRNRWVNAWEDNLEGPRSQWYSTDVSAAEKFVEDEFVKPLQEILEAYVEGPEVHLVRREVLGEVREIGGQKVDNLQYGGMDKWGYDGWNDNLADHANKYRVNRKAGQKALVMERFDEANELIPVKWNDELNEGFRRSNAMDVDGDAGLILIQDPKEQWRAYASSDNFRGLDDTPMASLRSGARYIDSDNQSAFAVINMQDEIVKSDVMSHELVHVHQGNSETWVQVERAWFRKRTRTSGQNFENADLDDPRYTLRPMREINPEAGYGPTEFAIENEFKEAYSGKLYPLPDFMGQRFDEAMRYNSFKRELHYQAPAEGVTMGTQGALWGTTKAAWDQQLIEWTTGMFGAF